MTPEDYQMIHEIIDSLKVETELIHAYGQHIDELTRAVNNLTVVVSKHEKQIEEMRSEWTAYLKRQGVSA